MTALPALDLHAHIEPSITGSDLDDLNATVFAVTRSLEEAQAAVVRTDRAVVWGVGCHPGLAASHRGFRSDRFAELLERTGFAGELGIDGRSRVPPETQRATLRAALEVLSVSPRLVSLHSTGATGDVLLELEATPVRGAILHWWLGDREETKRALDLGCYFSLNAAGVGRKRLLETIPIGRLLTETDHPFGDRRTPHPRPGNVAPVERAIARHHGVATDLVRRQAWRNLGTLVRQTGSARLLPRKVRAHLAAVSSQES